MKQLYKQIWWYIIQPTILGILFLAFCTGINYIIASLFKVTFISIQYSPIWTIWAIMGIVCTIIYYIEAEDWMNN